MTAFLVPSMLTQEQAMEIRVMARRGEGVRSIAKQLGCSRNTVRRYLREEGAKRYGPREARACKLDGYKSYLSERIEQARPRWIPATVLLREIRERGYDGGISQLKAWLGPYKRIEPEPVVRFETAPGVQMQADFTHVRRVDTRKGRPLDKGQFRFRHQVTYESLRRRVLVFESTRSQTNTLASYIQRSVFRPEAEQ